MIGIPAADILATLIYKQKYWKKEDRLIEYKEDKGFYISNADIIEETCYKIHTIKKGMKILKDKGLIISKQRGLNLPNFYKLDLDKINNYIGKNKDDYEKWRLKIREKNTSVTLVNSKKELKQLSGSNSDNFQEVTQTTTTKNKITKNKKLKTFTNRINADIKIKLSLDDLEDKISEIQQADPEYLPVLTKKFYSFLRDILPIFKDFKPSDKDLELINTIAESPIDCHLLAFKIKSNAQAIIDRRKECRFGNLFVGIKESSHNFEMKYVV